MLTQPKCLDDEGEVNKANEHDVEFLEPGKDAPESFQPSEKTFNFIAPFVHRGRIPKVRCGWILAARQEQIRDPTLIDGCRGLRRHGP